MDALRAFLKRKNIEISAKRYGIDALGAMAQGLFCTLLIGTILNTVGKQFGARSGSDLCERRQRTYVVAARRRGSRAYDYIPSWGCNAVSYPFSAADLAGYRNGGS